jgi:hypothetical protein
MLNCFGDLIGPTIEAYVDDIMVKSKQADQLVIDLEQTFMKLQANGIKLNLEKCVFKVLRGMLLGIIVFERGIEANPEKISAIMRMGPILNLKGVQRVMGCLAALNYFYLAPRRTKPPPLPASEESHRFAWTPEAREALDKLKELLMKAPILVPSIVGESLLLYIAATTQVVSAALVVEREEEGHALRVQCPVYFISEVLSPRLATPKFRSSCTPS